MTEQRAAIIAPIIHCNGTSAKSLMDALGNVYSAINDARDVLRECAPNGRDYYPQPGLMDRAIEQHMRRDRALSDLQAEIEAEIDAILAQTERR